MNHSSNSAASYLAQRQIHLDFHNSPYLPDICANFDAEKFADTFAEAGVESVTVFARCIHGMAYYPTKVGKQHPNMGGRDFLKEAIDALHARGIRAPIYITVTWEEGVAEEHPEWRQMYHNGRLASMNTFMDDSYVPGSQWKLVDFINPEYMDYIESYLSEIIDGYAVDGIFVDMVFYAPDASWSRAARKVRREHGIMGNDRASHIRFESLAQKIFCNRMTRFVQDRVPEATMFYNTPNNLYINHDQGAAARWDSQTHLEVESLPSGIWGYQHFPKVARRLLTQPKQWLGMTGRFQKMWGDFGGIKPQPALEYECFRTQALGGANSVGDQLLPDGSLDPDAYKLIGKVFHQCAAAEPFYENSETIYEIGILCPNHPQLDEHKTHMSEEGAVMLCEELRYECAVLDDEADFNKFRLIILPDTCLLTAEAQRRLRSYIEGGGQVLTTGNSGETETGDWFWERFRIQRLGPTEFYPNYWRPASHSGYEDLCQNDRVYYSQGLDLEPPSRAKILIDRVLPFFQRDDLHYCSHFQTPSSGKAGENPACFRYDNITCFADPIFAEYREKGNGFIKSVLARVIETLIGPPMLSGLKATVSSFCRRKDDDLLITLLHYLPVRKAVECDVIEERLNFDRQSLHLSKEASVVARFENGESSELEVSDNGICSLPPSEGRLLLCVPGFFK